jgi:putative acetyltransferase
VQLALENPNQPEIVRLIAELDAYQDSLYPPEARYALDMASLCLPNVLFAVARLPSGEAVGCGAVVLGPGFGELKRLYVGAAYRGQGVAGMMLGLLEQRARMAGCSVLMLESGPLQVEALKFYERSGFYRRGPFGDYPDHPLSVFMQKPLAAAGAVQGDSTREQAAP